MIICVVGPTGVGKTKLSVELAKKYNAIIINCDSTQVYMGMNIGTAKITETEKEGVPHYLFDIVPVTTNYTVYDYQKEARRLIEEFKGRNIIFVGGTGLYLKAVLYNYVFGDEAENTETYDDLTNEELYELVKKKDSKTEIHPNNRKRLVRFLNKKDITTPECNIIYDNVHFIGLTTDRETLYNHINERVEKMFDAGLEAEVKSFYDAGINSKALNTAIGYKELYQYFRHEISLEEAKELIKKNSRHYAKRQYTWFNNQMDVTWFNVKFSDFNKTIKEVEAFIVTKI